MFTRLGPWLCHGHFIVTTKYGAKQLKECYSKPGAGLCQAPKKIQDPGSAGSKIWDPGGAWIQQLRFCRGIQGILDPALQILLEILWILDPALQILREILWILDPTF